MLYRIFLFLICTIGNYHNFKMGTAIFLHDPSIIENAIVIYHADYGMYFSVFLNIILFLNIIIYFFSDN